MTDSGVTASSTTTTTASGPAPADARPHAPWPRWKMVLAYAALACLAAAAIWYVDLKAHRPPALRPAVTPPHLDAGAAAR